MRVVLMLEEKCSVGLLSEMIFNGGSLFKNLTVLI